jgi:hypothetical protein
MFVNIHNEARGGKSKVEKLIKMEERKTFANAYTTGKRRHNTKNKV